MTDNLDAGMGKDDLVKRLRILALAREKSTRWQFPDNDAVLPAQHRIESEAADEIERLRRPPDVAVLREALEFCIEHLEEMRKDPKWHPIGHCPVLDKARQALAGAGEVVPSEVEMEVRKALAVALGEINRLRAMLTTPIETPELVEKVARAICKAAFGDESPWP